MGTGQSKASQHNYSLLFLAPEQKNCLLASGLVPVPKIFQHFSPPMGYRKLCAYRFRLSTAQLLTCQRDSSMENTARSYKISSDN